MSLPVTDRSGYACQAQFVAPVARGVRNEISPENWTLRPEFRCARGVWGAQCNATNGADTKQIARTHRRDR
jgi:hypothetical protein